MPRRFLGAMSRKFAPEQYDLLPTDPSLRGNAGYGSLRSRRWSWRSITHALRQRLTLRRLLISSSLIPVFAVVAILCQGIPPSYNDIRHFERRLPQHDLALSSNERPRYLRFPGHLWGHGLNNILQETILMSYLAYMSNLSFVFEDYTWSHTPLPYTVYDFALRPARIPLNAIISGPTAGGPMSNTAPRAVSAEFWEHVCADKEKRYVISSEDAPNDADGNVIIDWWTEHLIASHHPCIEIDSSAHDLFDRFLFGGPRVLTLWDSLATSPILTDFTWSPLVQSAVTRNFALLQPESPKDLYDVSSPVTLPGLVAVHLRRGDYKRHCPNLAKWGAEYMGFNQHPSLPDRFDPQPYKNDSSILEDYYLEHCLPTIDQVVIRLRELRREHPHLRRVYVLSNDWAWWLDALKEALEEDGWDDLTSSLDIQLDAEQYYVAMAVDMAIAEKADVFVGNGFSSLSSNVVMLRMAKGMEANSNRFL
ncbi:hypothetical protein BJ138DRAFT_1091036 [Hygrophoropsis aurantiaca]|uniref:Uncharacterized protein n=1 Tax=Hygrophoropsis aurantiaca TaxID=72124 RepID=A0ACB8A5P9_9AGAM|nr:hypothetical protein BJ138DRAFT_1091036 [Hygrophoropsis aurantiaca]